MGGASGGKNQPPGDRGGRIRDEGELEHISLRNPSLDESRVCSVVEGTKPTRLEILAREFISGRRLIGRDSSGHDKADATVFKDVQAQDSSTFLQYHKALTSPLISADNSRLDRRQSLGVETLQEEGKLTASALYDATRNRQSGFDSIGRMFNEGPFAESITAYERRAGESGRMLGLTRHWDVNGDDTYHVVLQFTDRSDMAEFVRQQVAVLPQDRSLMGEVVREVRRADEKLGSADDYVPSHMCRVEVTKSYPQRNMSAVMDQDLKGVLEAFIRSGKKQK